MTEKHPAPSWGRLNDISRSITPFSPFKLHDSKGCFLPHGNGRSYGDSCHNDDGVLLDSRGNNALLMLDLEKGILRAQSGIFLSQILEVLKNTKWFLPVVPGTRLITLGGALANDIHGKNHGHKGTIGRHINRFVLHTSDGQTRTCTPSKNKAHFQATIGGMGLTGFVSEIELNLMRVPSHSVRERKTPFHSLNEFLELSDIAESINEYSVAWVDSLATGKQLGRGILITGEHCASDARFSYADPKINVPFTPPVPLVSGLPLRAFNFAYFHKNSRSSSPATASRNSFFFPLDAIGGWNKLYGPKGLFQHQCVLPLDTAPDALHALLRTSQLARHGSFLTVLKRFGNLASPGLLSFPQPGFTLTLDFPNKGQKTRTLLDELDTITINAGGRVNPYKDARMSAETFKQGFPEWEKLERYRDPAMMSDFWRRVTGLEATPHNRKAVAAPSLQTSLTQKKPVNQTSKPNIQKPKLKQTHKGVSSPRTKIQ